MTWQGPLACTRCFWEPGEHDGLLEDGLRRGCAEYVAPSPQADAINPAHYRSHPSGVECVDIAEHYGFLLGNCIKYVWRAGLKGDAVEDLKKAKWYLEREIAKREKGRVK